MTLGIIDFIVLFVVLISLKKTCDATFYELIPACFIYIGIKYLLCLVLK